MKLFKITRTTKVDYDTFESAVVAAVDERSARHIHPGGDDGGVSSWAPFCHVRAEYLGEARVGMSAGVIEAVYIG